MKTGERTRRPANLTWTLLFAIGTLTVPGAGASVLHTRPGSATIHESPGRSVEIPLAAGRVARSAAAAEGGHVLAGEDRASGDLFFVLRQGAGTRELPPPPAKAGGERAWPVVLSRLGRFEGAVWLEGPPQAPGLALVASVWNGGAWERLETVAPANGRPQLAPAATVLADGSWLVVWAGYDGDDDEIFWSRRRDGAWSAPRRVHENNRVPDLLPALTTDAADGGRALAAWSFYDGNDYRVRAALFADDRWAVGEPLAGLGAGDTLWQRSAGRSFVVFRSLVPEAWTAIELDEAGGVLHRVVAPGGEPEPPLVDAAGGTGAPRLVRPGRSGRPRR